MQRPDLFAVCLPAVGVMDMLRYHLFTIGWGWATEYGTSDDAAQFRTLYAYSPLHNIREGVCYPATLVTTATTTIVWCRRIRSNSLRRSNMRRRAMLRC